MYIEIKDMVAPPRKETLAANIAAQLKSLILKKQFKIGDKLPPERKLAQIFNVSRVVIKQALLALEYSGFIETELGSKGGAIVTFDFSKPITIFMEDLYNKNGLKLARRCRQWIGFKVLIKGKHACRLFVPALNDGVNKATLFVEVLPANLIRQPGAVDDMFNPFLHGLAH